VIRQRHRRAERRAGCRRSRRALGWYADRRLYRAESRLRPAPACRTRAERDDGEVYRIHGAKTWITHGARSDLMTCWRARSGSAAMPGSGCSSREARGGDEDPFTAEGMGAHRKSGMGYAAMKEYEIALDGFAVPAEGCSAEWKARD